VAIEVQNPDSIETTTLRSQTPDSDAAWVGGFFSYGGNQAEQSATIYFAVPPGERLGKHVDTAEETQVIIGGTGELLLDDGAKPIKKGDVFVLPEGTSHDLRNTGTEDLRVIAFFSKPQVEQHWDTETWPPDGSKVTGSPNRNGAS
jgi:quercetin dioxygenase-like cupin family protein